MKNKNSINGFQQILQEYDLLAPEDIKLQSLTDFHFRKIIPSNWPSEFTKEYPPYNYIHYEFLYWPKEKPSRKLIGVEIHIEHKRKKNWPLFVIDILKSVESDIYSISPKNLDAIIECDPQEIKWRYGHRLGIMFSLNTQPRIIVNTMIDLINQTREKIKEKLELIQYYSTNNAAKFSFPEEVIETEVLIEGAKTTISVNAYERNQEARRRCIAYYGTTCKVCHFDFKVKYGKVGENYIQVHHLKPISEIGFNYKVDPIKDLRPICPNCHAMIHRRNPPYSIEEIIDFINCAKQPKLT